MWNRAVTFPSCCDAFRKRNTNIHAKQKHIDCTWTQTNTTDILNHVPYTKRTHTHQILIHKPNTIIYYTKQTHSQSSVFVVTDPCVPCVPCVLQLSTRTHMQHKQTQVTKHNLLTIHKYSENTNAKTKNEFTQQSQTHAPKTANPAHIYFWKYFDVSKRNHHDVGFKVACATHNKVNRALFESF